MAVRCQAGRWVQPCLLGGAWLALVVLVLMAAAVPQRVTGAAAATTTAAVGAAASRVDSVSSDTEMSGSSDSGGNGDTLLMDAKHAPAQLCGSARRLLSTLARLEALMEEGDLNSDAHTPSGGEETDNAEEEDGEETTKDNKTWLQRGQQQQWQQQQWQQQQQWKHRNQHQNVRQGDDLRRPFAHTSTAFRLMRELQHDVPAMRALIAQQCEQNQQSPSLDQGQLSADTPSPAGHRRLPHPTSAIAGDPHNRVRRAPTSTTATATPATAATTTGTDTGDDASNGTLPRSFPVVCEFAQLIKNKCQDPRDVDELRIDFEEERTGKLDLGDAAKQYVQDLTQHFSPKVLLLAGTVHEPELRFLLEHGVWSSVRGLDIRGFQPTSFDFSMLRGFFSLENITLAQNDIVSLHSTHNHILHGGGAAHHEEEDEISAETVAMLGRLSFLNASFNSITQLDTRILSHLHNLSECWLEFNQVREIRAGTFQNLTSLTMLSLGNNRVSQIHPDAFVGLTSLRALGLGYNALSRLNTAIFQPLASLRKLYLEANPLQSLNPELLKPLTNLRTFQLSTTRVTELSPALFAANTQLRELYLFRNRISHIADTAFTTLTRLVTLDLSHNRLSMLPRRLLAGLGLLQRLALNNNAITLIERGAFAQLPRLARVDVQINQLTALDSSLFAADTNTRLEELEASTNMIEDVPLELLEQLPNLKKLSLSGNQLTTFLPSAPSDVSFNLTHLRLSKNPLHVFPSLRKFPMLVELEVKEHMVTSIEFSPLAHLQDLTTLEVSAHPDQDEATLHLDGDKVADVLAKNGGQFLNNLKRLDLRNLRLDGTRSFNFSQLHLTHLRLGWPGLDEDTLSLETLCSLMDAEAAEELDISDTSYRKIDLCNIGFDTVLLAENPKLHEVVVHTHVKLLNVSGCERLESVSLPSAELLDISGTRVKPDPGLCAGWGSRMLFARDWRNREIRKSDDAFRDLLARCLRTVDLIELSDNRWLSRPEKVSEAAAAVTVLSSQSVFTENSISLRTRANVPVLVMLNTPVNCRLQLSNVRGRLEDGTQTTRFAFWYDCSCLDGYLKRDGDCIPDRTHVYAIVFGSLAGLLVLQAVVLVAYRYVRRHRHLLREHDLKVQLLEERDEEVLALKRAWEIEYSELHAMTHLSTGAFGVVYKAEWDTVTVAVKVMQSKVTIFDDNMQREFEKEVEFLQRTRHPHVVRFFGAGTDPSGNPFLVLEFVALGSLKQLLFERDLPAVLQEYLHNSVDESGGEGMPAGLEVAGVRTSTVSDMVGSVMVSHGMGSQDDVPSVWALKQRLAHDVACGMAFIHSLNQVHRDLKSGNVLVSGRLRAKITDFGSIRQRLTSGAVAASALGSGAVGAGHDNVRYSQSLGSSTMHLSMTAGVGTPMYMAPEALYGRAYDQKADVFSFGVLLWEIATQQHPDIIQQEYGNTFDGPLFPTLLKLLRDEGKRLRFPESTASHPIPTWFKSLANDCMAAQPDERPAFGELVTSLT